MLNCYEIRNELGSICLNVIRLAFSKANRPDIFIIWFHVHNIHRDAHMLKKISSKNSYSEKYLYITGKKNWWLIEISNIY